INSFTHALGELRRRRDNEALTTTKPNDPELPVVPLVLGGDDLTVICDGRYAIQFTRDFLLQFERER
ncbi:MAG: hypothetical protein M3Q76_11835, partial [Acidobacteriota bacterium]|nr:hypothetical protein [Acidobacteriota bacterium]